MDETQNNPPATYGPPKIDQIGFDTSQPQQYAQSSQPLPPQYQQVPMTGIPQTNDSSLGLGVASLIFCVVLPPVGLTFGILGMLAGTKYTRATMQTSKGKTISLIGVVISILATIFAVMAILFFVIKAFEFNPDDDFFGTWSCTETVREGEYVELSYDNKYYFGVDYSISYISTGDSAGSFEGNYVLLKTHKTESFDRDYQNLLRARPDIGEYMNTYGIMISRSGGSGSLNLQMSMFENGDGLNGLMYNEARNEAQYCKKGTGLTTQGI
jgi:hypothetical protein